LTPSRPTEGCVLETFGAGNAPHRKDVVEALREATARGVVIVNITQCSQGSVSDKYAAGSHLGELGIVSGLDLTVEVCPLQACHAQLIRDQCALAKLSYLLAREDLDRQAIKTIISRPIRGELTTPVSKKQVSLESQWRFLFQHLISWKRDPTVHPSEETSASLSATEMQALGTAMLPILITRAAGQADGSLAEILTATEPSLDILNGAGGSYTHPPLFVAARSGSSDNVALLLERGASVHMPDPMTGMSVLFAAALLGHQDVVKLLKQAGAHFNSEELQSGRVEFERQLAQKQGRDVAWQLALES
jgi:lysophospholipase